MKPDKSKSNISAALQLWQAFEYLSPQKPPEVKCAKGVCNWEIPVDSLSDEDMPWVDPKKQDDLDKLFFVGEHSTRRFHLFAGVLPGHVYTNATREILGSPAISDDEKAGPTDAASLVLPIDEMGYVAGSPFVSSTPWALGNLALASRQRTHFDFSGFFGPDGAEAQTVAALKTLLVKNTLLPQQTPNSKELTTVSALLTIEKNEAEAEKIRKAYRTVTADDVREMTALLFEKLGWTPASQAPWVIKTQSASRKNKKELDDPLNSFYAEDIETVQRAFRQGNTGAALDQFLASTEAPERVDLDANDKTPLLAGVHPGKLPLAAWPGSHPLVTAQQFAVNTIQQDLASSGLFSVNGPPGTGKTTMLKDIVAAVVQQRADALMAFQRPEHAFREALSVENHKDAAWKPDASLCGHGIVVTSANNGAVENISRELPGLSSLDDSIQLEYFSQVSDSMGLGRKESRPEAAQTWGLISAALGNSTNRNAFASSFWYPNKECKKLPDGAPNPLAQVCLPEWIASHRDSVPSWEEARARYRAARAEAENQVAKAADLVDAQVLLPKREEQLAQLQTQERALDLQLRQLETHADTARKTCAAAAAALAAAASHLEHAKARAAADAQRENAAFLVRSHHASRPSGDVEQLTMEMVQAQSAEQASQRNLSNHHGAKPGLLTRWFSQPKVDAWERRDRQLTALIEHAQAAFQTAQKSKHALERWEQQLRPLQRQEQTCKDAATATRVRMVDAGFADHYNLAVVEKAHAGAQRAVSEAQQDLLRLDGLLRKHAAQRIDLQTRAAQLSSDIEAMAQKLVLAGLPDRSRDAWNLSELSRDDFHRASPYQDDGALFSARRALFVASMELHKAFVVHAWSKLKPTLSVFVDLLQGKLTSGRVTGGVMPLWDAFFLVVPLVSTAFASFPRLFKGVRTNDLAWLLIDEAGQAAPQQAIGAIWRSKRAVIVGDPIQLEPVVSIPQELVTPLQNYCDTPAQYIPPEASVQTMADRSNRYGTLMGSEEDGTALWLGSPLVVHRRCTNPMFQIANAIAYQNKMVYGTIEGAALDAPLSAWLDASNEDAEGHWIENQADRVLRGIKKLTNDEIRDEKGKLRIYVITPFKLVSERMREMLGRRFDDETAKEMCGTVHTFQGKEADFVIFLLGGDPSRPGVISGFAGRKPNLINVAVTRAKKRLFVIGSKAFWCSPADANGYYNTMEDLLSTASRAKPSAASEPLQ